MIEVSIIIPCRNEEKFIGKCLESLIEQDYPKENLEVLVIDGMSRDGTRKIVKEYIEKFPFIKLLENPQKFTPFGLNIGIKEAQGEIIIRMDSHAAYQKDYISKCLKYLKETGADNVGGVIKTTSQKDTLVARAIAVCLSSFFGAGTSYFRTGSEKPRWVDTVFGGCYKKEVFEKIGLFNEKLIRSQDIEFNRRLRKSGGKILLIPDIISYYYPHSDFFKFLKHNFSDGIWTILPLKFGVRIFSWRHLLPLLFVAGLIILLLLSFLSKIFFLFFLIALVFYILISLYFSFKLALREKDFQLFFILPFVFANRHFAYGLGSVFGLIKIII